MIFPVAVADPKVILENPSNNFPSSVSLSCKDPLAEVPKPIVVVAVFGAIVKVDVPEILAPTSIAFVVIESALAPMVIVPLAPMLTVFALRLVAPRKLLLPTAPLIAITTEGGLIAITSDWGIDEVILENAGPAEVEARIRICIGRVNSANTDGDTAAEIKSGEVSFIDLYVRSQL